MHKSEARKLGAAVDRQGMTIVVTKVYFNEDNRLKMEVALAKGKNVRDKRQDIKARDLGRDVRRELKNWG
jgi:SsrA-binding protein